MKIAKKKAEPVLITKFFSLSQSVSTNSSKSQNLPVAGPSRISQEAERKNINKTPVEKLIDAVSKSDSEVDNVPTPENTQQKQQSNYEKEMDIIMDSDESNSDLNVILDICLFCKSAIWDCASGPDESRDVRTNAAIRAAWGSFPNKP